MKKIIFTILVFNCFLAFSQSVDEQTDIVLPPMFLEIDDTTKENVDTILPTYKENNIPLPNIDIPLPEPKELELDGVLSGTVLVKEKIQDDKSKYLFDATIGLGSMIYLLGDFKITRVAENNKLSLAFKHKSSDGYNFKTPGEGFFDREDSLTFNFNYNDKKKYNNILNIGFEESAFGLQNLSPTYKSITDRFFYLNNSLRVKISDIFNLSFIVDLDLVDRRGDYAGENNFTNLLFSPEFDFNINFEKGAINIKTLYRIDSAVALKKSNNYFDLFVDFKYELPYALNISGGAGLFWSEASKNITDELSIYRKNLAGVNFPFFLTLDGNVEEYLSYSFSGGFENSVQDYGALSTNNKFLGFKQGIELSGWFAKASLKYKYKTIFTLNTGIEWNNKTGYANPNLETVNSAGLFDFDWSRKNFLFLNLGFEVKPIKEVTIKANWVGEVLPKEYYQLIPEHKLDFSLGYMIPKEWFGGALNLLFEKYNESYIPEIGLDFYFKIDKNVKINIQLQDLLAPIYKEGRPTSWGNFIKPGFNAAIFAEIKY